MVSRLPVVDPRRFDDREEAETWRETLAGLGAEARVIEAVGGAPCVAHEHFVGRARCVGCEAAICVVCAATGDSRCPTCAKRAGRSRRFFRIRISILLVLLAGVLLYAWRDVRSRALRTDWKRPLRVAVVVVAAEPVDGAALARLGARVGVLERRLADEMRRHGSQATTTPFVFTLTTASSLPRSPPRPGEEPSWMDAARFAWDLSRFTRAVDESAGVDEAAFDARIYLVVRAPLGRVRQFEGIGEQGGRVGGHRAHGSRASRRARPVRAPGEPRRAPHRRCHRPRGRLVRVRSSRARARAVHDARRPSVGRTAPGGARGGGRRGARGGWPGLCWGATEPRSAAASPWCFTTQRRLRRGRRRACRPRGRGRSTTRSRA